MDSASAELKATGPAKVANSDAKALQRYLAAVGVEIGADRLNDLLVLFAVLMLEAGGGLSLAIGMSLSSPAAGPPAAAANATTLQAEQPRTPPAPALDAAANASDTSAVQPERTRPASVVRPSDVASWLRLQGGRAETSMRRLADALGRSPSGVHDELRRLVASGLITLNADSRGTQIALVAPLKPN